MTRDELLAIIAASILAGTPGRTMTSAIDWADQLLIEIEARARRRPATTVKTMWDKE